MLMIDSENKTAPLWNLQEWRDEAEEWRGSKIGEFEVEVLADDFDACFRDGVIAGMTPCSAAVAFARQPRQGYQLPPAIRAIVPDTLLPAPDAAVSVGSGYDDLDEDPV